jgi:hypothetical protein
MSFGQDKKVRSFGQPPEPEPENPSVITLPAVQLPAVQVPVVLTVDDTALRQLADQIQKVVSASVAAGIADAFASADEGLAAVGEPQQQSDRT